MISELELKQSVRHEIIEMHQRPVPAVIVAAVVDDEVSLVQ